MWLSIDNELWNLDNCEGIVCEDADIILVYPNHREIYECQNGVPVDSVMAEIERNLKDGVRLMSGYKQGMIPRSEGEIYERFG